jgi:hypothetical protein
MGTNFLFASYTILNRAISRQVALESNNTINRAQAIGLVTTRLHCALGTKATGDLVAYRGGTLFDLHAKAVAVVSIRRGTLELF